MTGFCDVIEAEFRYGPVRCLRQTDRTTEDDGETFYICEEHEDDTPKELRC